MCVCTQKGKYKIKTQKEYEHQIITHDITCAGMCQHGKSR